MYKRNNVLTSGLNEDRMWSDDQGFLDTIAGLTNKAHEASVDPGQDVYDWFWLLEQLQLEISGQLIIRNLTSEKSELDDLRKKTSANIDKAYDRLGSMVGNLKPQDASKLRSLVYPYHEKINVLIHKMDLRLHEVKPKADDVPTWSEN